jgi:hypothetical protein
MRTDLFTITTVPTLVVGLVAFARLLSPLRPRRDAARTSSPDHAVPEESAAALDLRDRPPAWSLPEGPQVPVSIRANRACPPEAVLAGACR